MQEKLEKKYYFSSNWHGICTILLEYFLFIGDDMVLRKTKIVCSIGPCSDDETTIRKLILSGMNVARFNFSHGTYKWHKTAMDKVKKVSNEIGIPVAILMDTKGPEIRTGMTENNQIIKVSTGDKIEVTADDSECYGSINGVMGHISLSWKDLPKKMKRGMRILIADGLSELEVDYVNDDKVFCTAMNTCSFGSKKNVNLLGVHAGLPIMSEQDKSDIVFCVEQNMDYIAASFVSFPEEIIQIREYLDILGSNAHIIAKIENGEGVENIDEIIKVADGIMVARGDLGVQIPTESIPLVQKSIIKKCRLAGKPVITATQMLDSMIINPRPTRAELTDVANAVFDGTDAVMLSGETAGGKYPVESVQTMSKVTFATESSTEYYERMLELENACKTERNVGSIVARTAFSLAVDVNASAIFTLTKTGTTAGLISRFRPRQVIIALTQNAQIRRQLMLNWGVLPVFEEIGVNTEDTIQKSITKALSSKLVAMNDSIIIASGVPAIGALSLNAVRIMIVGTILCHGDCFINCTEKKERLHGRIISYEHLKKSSEDIEKEIYSIFVCRRITEDFIPVLKHVSGVIAESGSDIAVEKLHNINKNIICITEVPSAIELFEEGLYVTIDGEKGIIYNGFV